MGKKKSAKAKKKNKKNKTSITPQKAAARVTTLKLEPTPQIIPTLQLLAQNISSEILSNCLVIILNESRSILNAVSSQKQAFVLGDAAYFYFFKFVGNINHIVDGKAHLLNFHNKYIEILKVLFSSLQQVESRCSLEEEQCIRVNRLLKYDQSLRINDLILETGKRISILTLYLGDVDQCEKYTADLLKRTTMLRGYQKEFWEVVVYSQLARLAAAKNQERNIRIYSGLAERALSRYLKHVDKEIPFNHNVPFTMLYAAYEEISEFQARINSFEEAAEWLEDALTIGKKNIEVFERQIAELEMQDSSRDQRLQAIELLRQNGEDISKINNYKDKARNQKIEKIQSKIKPIFVEDGLKVNKENDMVRFTFSKPVDLTLVTNIFRKRKIRFTNEEDSIVFNLDQIRTPALDSLLEQIISDQMNQVTSNEVTSQKNNKDQSKTESDVDEIAGRFSELSTAQQKQAQLERHLAKEKEREMERELERSLGKLPEESEPVYGPVQKPQREIRWNNPEYNDVDPENDKESYFQIYGRPGNATYLMFSPKLTFTDGSLEDKAKSVARSGKFLTSKLSKGRQGIVHYKPEKQAEKIRKLEGYSWKIKMRSFEARPVGKTVAIGTVFVDGKATDEKVELVEVDQVVRKTHKQ